MKTRNGKMKLGVLAFAVQGALIAMYAMPVHADDDEVTALTTPTNYVNIGAETASKDSAKFGEYNGLNKSKDGDLIANFGLRGGDSYGDGTGTKRWTITGTDLGTTSRELSATMSDQGQWNLGIKYDELQHNTTTGYQTPYQGSMGGNSFVLPAGFGTGADANALSAGKLYTVDVDNTRKNTSLTAGLNLTPQWAIKFDYNRLDQSGAKLMAFGADGHGGAGGEAGSILPNPTNYTTDTINLALNWVGDKGNLSASYYVSSFKDHYDRVTWDTYKTTNVTDTMATAPSNDFHQLNLSGGYALSPITKLTGGLSYGRNTQNSAFVVPDIMLAPSPTASLDGLVVTSHADLKLVNQTTKDLALSAGVKFDERNNRTASNIYLFNAIDGAAHAENYSNTPLSNKKTQYELAGDYRLNKNQHVRIAYNREDVKRWCDQYAGNNGSPAGVDCVVATSSKDDKLSATYKLKASDDLNLSAGYAYSDRKTDSNPLAITSMVGKLGSATLAVPLGTVLGQNGGDFQGFMPYFDASRTQQIVKAGVNWQANEKLSFGLGGRFTDDKYGDSIYGVQNGNSWSFNLDATYRYSENGTISPYLTQQHRQRDMTSLQSLAAIAANATRVSGPAGGTWTNKLKDDDITIGLGAKQGGLMGGKLDLAGDLTYSFGKTSYGTQLNYTGLNNAGLTCDNPAVGSCGQLPDIKNTMTQLKLNGDYKLDKKSKVAMVYIYQKLSSDDWLYNGNQSGYSPLALMPTNQQSGSYSVNVIAASYIYTFK